MSKKKGKKKKINGQQKKINDSTTKAKNDSQLRAREGYTAYPVATRSNCPHPFLRTSLRD